jgi:hypothetical protein
MLKNKGNPFPQKENPCISASLSEERFAEIQGSYENNQLILLVI